MVIRRFKSYPYTDKKRGCPVTEHTEMSHIPNLNQLPQRAEYIRTTVTELQGLKTELITHGFVQ